MSSFDDHRHFNPYAAPPASAATVEDEYVRPEIVQRPVSRRILTPLVLFAATCVTTYLAGGWGYAVCVMLILLTHELGHYIQAVRYGVPASLPYFIPMPISPLGTMGAVIGMRGHMGDRKALFDIGISGPLAGLVPTLICCVVGMQIAHIAPVPAGSAVLGDPLLIKLLSYIKFGPMPPGHDIMLNPILYAGWVGLLVTAVNLFPIGQLDGGHVLYALLRTKAHIVARLVLLACLLAMGLTGNLGWSLMLMLLVITGPDHPPTADDDVPLGTGRIILGWATLLFLIIGFTPTPFSFA